jgi:uncharacterized protein YbjT (DUF2867 family)
MDEETTMQGDGVMRVAVTGGTGTLGREVVRELELRGYDVRALSRSTGVDLTSGQGLDAALEGIDVVVDAANGGPRAKPAEAVLVHGTRRLLAAEAAAGVSHHVAISIVGVDRARYAYNRLKLEQEALVRHGTVPWTIVRATQFHSYVDGMLSSAARFGVLPAARIPLQPVDVREVGVVLADTAEAEASGEITQFAGPEILTLRELARQWRDAVERHPTLVRVPLPGEVGRELRDGALTNPGAWTGRRTFGAYLRERYASAAPAMSAGARVGGAA